MVASIAGNARVISFQSRQLKAVEKYYLVHDKELLVMKYAVVKTLKRKHRIAAMD